MIAIVLAGGYAKRLWPLTLNRPKALLPIAGKPIIDYVVEKLILIHPPVKRIVISTNLKFQPQFQAWLKKRMHRDVELKPDNSWSEEDKPGAIGAVANILTELDNEDTLVVAGDNLFNDDLKDFLRFVKDKHAATIALYHAKDLNEVRRGAAVTIDDQRKIVEFAEKPAHPKTTLVGACIYAFQAKIQNKIHKYLELDLPKDEPGRLIEWLHKQEPVYGYMLKDYLWDIGTLESYKAADKFFTSSNS